MANELDIKVVIRQLEDTISIEESTYKLETMLHELGYLRCLLEHGIEDVGRVEHIQNYLSKTK